jgi:phosphoribosyl-AMP cyclohydrolase
MIETEAMHATSLNSAIKKISTLLLSLTILGAAVSPRNAFADALGDAYTAYQSRNYAVARDIWTKLCDVRMTVPRRRQALMTS